MNLSCYNQNMTEKIPQNNISNFEEEKLRAEQEKKRVEKNRVQQETQQEENVARSYLQDNPEMLLSFLRSHESILTEESLSPETRIRIKKYLSDIVSVIMSARNHDDSVFKLQQEGIANPGEDEQGNFQITLENFVDPIIIMCLDEMKSRERVADVISLHGAENTLTQEEIFEQKILMTFNAIDDFYADAEKASVTSPWIPLLQNYLELLIIKRNLLQDWAYILHVTYFITSLVDMVTFQNSPMSKTSPKESNLLFTRR